MTRTILSLWAMQMAIGATALETANCHRYAIWRYPWAQSCQYAVIHRDLPTEAELRAAAIEKLKPLLEDLLNHEQLE